MNSLRNQFLIAMPSMNDPNFSRSVTYICEHADTGSMGLVINLPLSMSLQDIYQQLNLTCNNDSTESRLLAGGPVQVERGFVLHTPCTEQQWESTLEISDEVSLTTSADIMTSLASGNGPENYLPILGYAGWDAGQLEEEIANNEWLTVEASPQILFHEPYAQRWATAARLLGIDLNLLSSTAGHA